MTADYASDDVKGPTTSDRRGRFARKPALAALASLLLPGLGQFYNGRLERALRFFIAFAIVSIPVLGIVALYAPPAATVALLALSVLLALMIWIGAAIDAWRDAGRLNRGGGFRPQPWQTVGTYTVVVLLCHGLYLPLAISYLRQHQVQPFRIPSASMAPTLLPGDVFFADMSYNCPGCRREVARDDIAVFIYPNNRNHHYVKRIVGLPGDRIEIEAERLLVNGQPLEARAVGSEHTAAAATAAATRRPFAGPRSLIVPPGSVFVLGDNREQSTDSRDFDPVPLRDVVGKVRQIWFSRGTDGVRWSRLGRLP